MNESQIESQMSMQVYRLTNGTFYCTFIHTVPPMGVLRTQWVTQVVARTGALKVLDLAGGNGEISKFIAQWAHVTLLDHDEKNRDVVLKSGIQKFVHAQLQ